MPTATQLKKYMHMSDFDLRVEMVRLGYDARKTWNMNFEQLVMEIEIWEM